MQKILKIKKIESFTYESIEYVYISIYFLDIVKTSTSTFAFITKEIYLINDLKVKILIEKCLTQFRKISHRYKKNRHY